MGSGEMEILRGWRGCQLDGEDCLSLEQILHSFSAPISEEHAWAVIHQALQCLSKLLDDLARPDPLSAALAVTSTKHILINTEGRVHRNTFLQGGNNNTRQRISSENKTVAELGVVIFTALDYGLKEEEERQLSPALENVIDLMTSADEEEELTGEIPGGLTDDEGIEDDHEESDSGSHQPGVKSEERLNVGKSGTCDTLISLCRHHLALPSEADTHFRAVCRALVTEAVELTSFMEKVSGSKSQVETDSELGQLDIQDWARLWVQVIHELRSGVRLKKTEYTRTPIEYELTPYEILMDDIRSKRYKLNKVMVEGRLPPKVKRDAHDVILEFIRSRPPLKPAAERKLAVMRKQSTPVELLMESIRSEKSRSSLRKTSGPPARERLVLTTMETSRCKLSYGEVDSPHMGMRKIQPDPDLMSSLLNFSDEEDEEEEEESGDDREEDKVEKTCETDKTGESGERRSSWRKQLALDAILHGPRLASHRRHSVSVCETPGSGGSHPAPPAPPPQPNKRISVDEDCEGLQSPDSSLSSSRGSLSSSDDHDQDPAYHLNTPEMHANLQSEFIHSDHWINALQTLELSLEEVVHIRSVLTRAELDALPLDNNVKQDVERGKICFLCMKTRFGLFSRGTRCEMCSQVVCIFALSPPGTSPEPEPSSLVTSIKDIKEKVSSLAPDLSLFYSTSSAGSAPSSPVHRRKMSPTSDPSPTSSPTFPGPTSLPVFTSQGPSCALVSRMGEMRRALSRGEESEADRGAVGRNRKESLIGTLLCVCTDCKEMVLQVIRAQKTARRLQMTQSLFLSLSPAFSSKQEIH